MIRFQDVSKNYGENSPVLDKINFLIEKGSFVYLVGPTGSGKTTIFRLIIRDLLPSEGMISIGEWDLVNLPKSKVPVLRRKVGVVFQDLKLLMDRTVIENVMLPLQLSGTGEVEAQRKAEEILVDVGLEDKMSKFPMQLSGGERQRVAIARALVFDPEIILADEPTGNLDNQTSFQILDLLKSINSSRGTTIFMATHNDRIIEKTGDRVIVIERGKLAEDRKASSKPVKEKEEKKEEEKHEAKKKDKEEPKEEKKGKLKLEALAAKQGGKE